LPFVRHGLARGEQLLVVLRGAARLALEDALGDEVARVDFADATTWYVSPEHAFRSYTRYVDDQLERCVPRVRIVAEVVWPESGAKADVDGWKRYEAGISVALASTPVSFICAYDTRALPAAIVDDARRTHPILRSAAGGRPSADYVPPNEFIRELER
jgi:hypothetical protein